MELIKKIEDSLAKLFKDMPHLPENGRKWLTDYAWLLSLIGGVFGIISGFLLLTGVLFVSAVTTTYDVYGTIYSTAPVRHYLALAWIALAVLIAYSIMLLMASSKLKLKQRAGWNLLFYGSLFYLGYDIFNWLQYPSAVGS